jgi:hypothetical protein
MPGDDYENQQVAQGPPVTPAWVGAAADAAAVPAPAVTNIVSTLSARKMRCILTSPPRLK